MQANLKAKEVEERVEKRRNTDIGAANLKTNEQEVVHGLGVGPSAEQGTSNGTERAGHVGQLHAGKQNDSTSDHGKGCCSGCTIM